MSIGSLRHARPARIAALHRQGEQWRLAVAERTGAGSARVVAAESIPYGDTAAVAAALSRLEAPHLLRIVPACAVVCRTMELADGPEESLLSALSLQAEAMLPASAPMHRRAVGLLGVTVGGGRDEGEAPRRVGLMAGWTGAAPEPSVRGVDETWVSESVVLSQLLGGLNSTLAAWADRDSGSIAVVGAGEGRVVVRGIRETAASSEQWNASVAAAVHEAARVVGIRPAPEPEHDSTQARALVLDAASRRRLSAMAEGARTSEPRWLHQFGIAALAATACVSASASTIGLYDLTDQARRERSTAVERAASWISTPRHARGVIAAAVVVMLLAPLAYAAARNAILGWRVSQVQRDSASQETQDALEKRVAVYAELDKRRWPMSKLLADVAGAMPVGTDLEYIQLGVGDRIVLRGTAESLELVSKVQRTLDASNVFDNVEIDKAGPASSGSFATQFDLSGRVIRPYTDGKGLEDFAENTLARRLYGERAEEAVTAHREGRSGPTASRGAGASGTRAGNGGRREIFDRTTPTEPKAPEPVPEPLDAAAIGKLSREDAGRELASRRKAASRTDVDAETRQRLRDEQDKLRQRLRDIQSGGGS